MQSQYNAPISESKVRPVQVRVLFVLGRLDKQKMIDLILMNKLT